MKKYRYGEVGPYGFNILRNKWIYTILAWNAFGYCSYRVLTCDEGEAWQQLTLTQKYISLMLYNDQEVEVREFKGLHQTNYKKMLVEDYIIPKRPDDNK